MPRPMQACLCSVCSCIACCSPRTRLPPDAFSSCDINWCQGTSGVPAISSGAKPKGFTFHTSERFIRVTNWDALKLFRSTQLRWDAGASRDQEDLQKEPKLDSHLSSRSCVSIIPISPAVQKSGFAHLVSGPPSVHETLKLVVYRLEQNPVAAQRDPCERGVSLCALFSHQPASELLTNFVLSRVRKALRSLEHRKLRGG